MSDFDAVKAYREEVESVAGLVRTFERLKAEAAERLAHAEDTHNDVLKSEAFMRHCLEVMRERLRAMESEAEQASKGVG